MSLTVKRKKRVAAGAALLLATVASAVAPVPAQAQWAVFDASNFSQNVMTAARELQQVNNQIQSLQHQAQMILNEGQMLVNQGKNLTSLATSPLAMLQQDVQRTQALLTQAQGLATQVAQLDQQFGRQYPMSYSASTPSSQMVMDAQTRWTNSLNALHTTLDMQAQVNASITADQGTLGTVVGSSQGAVGILQAVQATNQLLALMAKQTMQSEQMRIAQDRATALQSSQTLEADQVGQATRLQFQGSGVAYTPAPVQVFPQ